MADNKVYRYSIKKDYTATATMRGGWVKYKDHSKLLEASRERERELEVENALYQKYINTSDSMYAGWVKFLKQAKALTKEER